MATIALLRTTYLNTYLHVADAAVKPWSSGERDRLLTDSLVKLWPRFGVLAYGDIATDSSKDIYNVPGALLDNFRISRIDLLDGTGAYVDRIRKWLQHDATRILIKPRIATGATLRVYAWVPFASDGSDLPVDLEETVAHRAASRAYGDLAAELLNSERQQNLDSGRIVSYADAVGFAAYHERLFIDGMADHPARVSFGPRASRRG
jgi:hypothetical protein